jgi:hypothetical protein
VVEAAAAPCSWTRVTRVTETATAVAVTIETWRCPRVFPGTAELRVRDVTVELSRDLGDRTVTDSFGTAIPPKPGG